MKATLSGCGSKLYGYAGMVLGEAFRSGLALEVQLEPILYLAFKDPERFDYYIDGTGYEQLLAVRGRGWALRCTERTRMYH